MITIHPTLKVFLYRTGFYARHIHRAAHPHAHHIHSHRRTSDTRNISSGNECLWRVGVRDASEVTWTLVGVCACMIAIYMLLLLLKYRPQP